MGNSILRWLPGRKVKPDFRTVQPNHMVDESIPIKKKGHPNYEFSNNFVRTTRYTILTFLPKNLYEQLHRFANIYFIGVVALNWIPQIQAFAKEVAALPVVFVLLVTALKDVWEDIRRYRSDKAVNSNTCMVYSKTEKKYVKTEWANIYPGDFVHISCNAVIPADILFIRSSDKNGFCHVETSNIDGESNLKQREIVQTTPPIAENIDFSPEQFTYSVVVEHPNPEIYSFRGYLEKNGERICLNNFNLLLRGCIIKNTDFIEGLVVYAGSETKAMQNNKGPRHKISRLESKINRDVIWCIILLLFLCFFCAIGSGIWLNDYTVGNSKLVPFVAFSDDEQSTPLYQGFLVFWTYIIIFQSVIPLPLYVSMELVKICQVYFIMQDIEMYDSKSDKPVECRALNITEDLGQIEYIFSDKTGTLTENKMEFKCCTIGGLNYQHISLQDGNGAESHSDFGSIGKASSMMDNTCLEPALERELHFMSSHSLDSEHLTFPYHVRCVQAFFLLMAVCNTVFVSHHKHADLMDESGKIDESIRRSKPSKPTLKEPVHSLNRPQAFDKTKSGLSLNSETSSLDSSNHSQEIHYEAESPDELALVKAAHKYGCKLMHRSPGKVKVKMPGEAGEVEFKILRILHFDATRKRMSVIIRNPKSNKITLFVKGADSSIFSVLHKRYFDDKLCIEDLRNMRYHLDGYAKMGLRTLCMAKRVLSENEYKEWEGSHKLIESFTENTDDLIMESICRLEKDLELLGATGIEDRLQEGVPETIRQLHEAGIKVWVLTGDKQETAIQIAYSAQLFPRDGLYEPIIINADSEEATRIELESAKNKIQSELCNDSTDPNTMGSRVSLFSRSVQSLASLDQEREIKKYAVVIDGTTLNFATSPALQQLFLSICKHSQSVVCCRASPIQKATVVKLIRDNLKKMTLAIGDGANDVSMIQTADIGVGISGQEGMQAVMASDFSIARFRFLERLLLVHGHWNHDRLAQFAALMFYKSLISVLVLFWFQIYSGFSGSLMVDSLYLTMQHVIFTAAPPLANGIFDKDLNSHTLLDNPSLYKPGQRGQMYTHWTFFIVTIDVIYQSVVLYFLPHLAYKDHITGLWEFGTTINVCTILCILLHICIETRSWVWIQFGAIVLSFTLFWGFLLISNAIFFTFDHPSNPYWVMENTIATASHSAIVVITCFVALLPRLLIRVLQMTLFPNEICKARSLEKHLEQTAMMEEISVNETTVASTNLTSNGAGVLGTPHPHPNSFDGVYFKNGLQEKMWSYPGAADTATGSNMLFNGNRNDLVGAWIGDEKNVCPPSFHNVPVDESDVRRRGQLKIGKGDSLFTHHV